MFHVIKTLLHKRWGRNVNFWPKQEAWRVEERDESLGLGACPPDSPCHFPRWQGRRCVIGSSPVVWTLLIEQLQPIRVPWERLLGEMVGIQARSAFQAGPGRLMERLWGQIFR